MTRLNRRLAAGAFITTVGLVALCSIAPRAPPAPLLPASMWIAEDGVMEIRRTKPNRPGMLSEGCLVEAKLEP